VSICHFSPETAHGISDIVVLSIFLIKPSPFSPACRDQPLDTLYRVPVLAVWLAFAPLNLPPGGRPPPGGVFFAMADPYQRFFFSFFPVGADAIFSPVQSLHGAPLGLPLLVHFLFFSFFFSLYFLTDLICGRFWIAASRSDSRPFSFLSFRSVLISYSRSFSPDPPPLMASSIGSIRAKPCPASPAQFVSLPPVTF